MNQLAQYQLLQIADSAGIVYHRWQKDWPQQVVTHGGEQWSWQQFETAGITGGSTGDEGSVTVTLPAFPLVVDAANLAMALGHQFTILVYQFTPTGLETGPPEDREVLVAQFEGQIINASDQLTMLQLQLGSTLSPVGAHIPPRTMTTRLIGKGCRL